MGYRCAPGVTIFITFFGHILHPFNVKQRWAQLIKKLTSLIVNPLTKKLISLTVNPLIR